jgi:hypothetical protein
VAEDGHLEGGLTDDDRPLIAEYVRNVLAQLRLPYIVYVNAMPDRRVWRGLQNEQLDIEPPPDERAVWLPGLVCPQANVPLPSSGSTTTVTRSGNRLEFAKAVDLTP